MPNVILKNENGEPITYNNVRSVTIPNDQGLATTFHFGIPDETPICQQFNAYLKASGASGGRLAATIYTGNNYRLVGTNTFPDFGLWLVTSYDAVQLYSGRGCWVNFIPVPGGVLISTNSSSYGTDSQGILFYDEAEMTVRKITNLGYGFSNSTSYYTKLDNGILVYYSNVCLYVDYSDFSVMTVFNQSFGSLKVLKTPDGVIICPSSSTDLPIRIFYEDTKTVVVGTTNTCYIANIVKMKDDHYIAANTSYSRYMQLIIPSQGIIRSLDVVQGAFGRVYEYPEFVLFGSYNSSYNYGLYLIDRETLEITRLLTTGCSFEYRVNTPHGSLFYSSSSNSSYRGYIYFDKERKTAIRKDISGCYWNYVVEVKNGLFIGSSNYSGFHYFDYDTQEDAFLYNSYSYWSNAYYDEVNDCLIAYSQNNSCGILVYDFVNATATRYTSYYYQSSFKCGHKIFFISQSYTGVWVYDDRTKTVAQDTTFSNTYYGLARAVPGGCLIVSNYNGDGSIYFYDEDEDTITRLATGNAGTGVLEDGDEIIFYSNNSSYTGGIRVYNKTTRTITLVYNGGYYWTKLMNLEDGYIFVSNNYGMYRYYRDTKRFVSVYSSFTQASYIDKKEIPGGVSFLV